MIAFGAASPFNCLSVKEGVVLFVSFQNNSLINKCHPNVILSVHKSP